MLMRTASSSPAADVADIVCADPDLLALEFAALVAAEYPDPVARPAPRPPRGTTRTATRRAPRSRPDRPLRTGFSRSAGDPADEEAVRARQRGPPAAGVPRPSAQEVVLDRRTGRDRSPPHRTRTAVTILQALGRGDPSVRW
jgi:hypothetical protein